MADMSAPARFTRRWRDFRRMQNGGVVVAALIYAAATVHAWRVLDGPVDLKRAVLLGVPGFFLLLALWCALVLAPLRRLLKRYVWLSFVAGFGQSPLSVVTGLGVLAIVAVFLFLEVAQAREGGRWPAGAFSAMGAGLGVLAAQAALMRLLEREPKIREIITDPSA